MAANRVSHLSDPRQNAAAMNKALRKTDALDLSADQLTVLLGKPLDITGSMNVSGHYSVAGTQVVGAPDTGWVADTGTASKTTHATYTAPTISNPPTQAEVQAIANALQAATQEIKALKDLALLQGFARA